jgi:hypothetical protein
VRLHVLPPGEVNGLYHGENQQEDFLVLAGDGLLRVDGTERRLRRWASSTARPGRSTSSSAPDAMRAARDNASANREASNPDEAYVGTFEPSRRERPSYWSQLPWA